MIRQPKAERELIAYAKKTFGEHLGALLLCGYGEEGAPSSRDFVVESAGGGEAATRSRLMFVAEGPAGTSPCLPRRKEPLVLLALIQLLMGGGAAAGGGRRVAAGDVPAILGWDETDKSREAVTAAAARYFHTFYQLVDGPQTGGGRGPGESTRKLRLLSGYEVGGGAGGGAECSVSFNPEFAEALRRGQFLGIDWKRVKGLTPLPLEFFNL
ncbi:MAG TPA: hypothetical protein VF736_14365 [Pyrinomonadaceae bacterium]|jgi:hypothetical protein